MKSLTSIFIRDIVLIYRNKLLLVVLLILAVMTIIYHVIPDTITRTENRFFADLTEKGLLKKELTRRDFPTTHIMPGEKELRDSVKQERGRIGILVADGTNGRPVFTVIHNGFLTDKEKVLLHAGLERTWMELSGNVRHSVMPRLEMGGEKARIRLRDSLLSVLMAFEVMVLGFLFVAVLLFQEKQEGGILSYRVTPGGAIVYTGSKAILWGLVCTLYGILLGLLTIGPGPWILPMIPLVFLSSFFMTALGLLVAVFFKNISEWFFIGLAVLAVNMLPQVSLLNPQFSPAWLSMIPSYPVIHLTRELLIHGRYPEGALFQMALLTVECAAVFLMAAAAVKLRLLREVR